MARQMEQTMKNSHPPGRSGGDFRVIRGGSHSVQTRLLRSANRGAWLPETSSEKTGFRVVLGELPRGKLLPPAPPPLNATNVSQSVPKIEMPPATEEAPAPPPELMDYDPFGLGMMGGMRRGPAAEAKPVVYEPSIWGRYAKVLLSSSEFLFIN